MTSYLVTLCKQDLVCYVRALHGPYYAPWQLELSR